MKILIELCSGNRFALLGKVSVNMGPCSFDVPRGYITDFASIPSYLHWWIRPTDDRAVPAAIAHDWMYHTHIVTRGVADAIFLQLLREHGMPRRKAKLMAWAVRQFGKRPYMRGPDELRERQPELAHHIKPTPEIE